MLLIIEIILTIAAWRKGWRGWALLPVGVCLFLAFFIGFVIGASGGSPDAIAGIGFLLDILATVALIIMTVKAPRGTKKNVPNAHLSQSPLR